MGAHAALFTRVPPYHTIMKQVQLMHVRLLLALGLVLSSHVILSDAADTDALLRFKSSLKNAQALADWDRSVPPCNRDAGPNWNGVLCSKGGTIKGLQIQDMGLKGKIDLGSLAELKDFITISLMNNDFDGPLPELNKLPGLKSAYFSNNKFSGKIPDDAFTKMGALRKLHLAKNELTGDIPSSLAALPRLVELHLEQNKFEGKIPDFKNKDLRNFNVSANALEGPIPSSLSRIDKSAFLGNKGVCGKPLDACPDDRASSDRGSGTSTDPASGSEGKRSPVLTIVVVVIVVVVALIALVTTFIVLGRGKKRSESVETPSSNAMQAAQAQVIPRTRESTADKDGSTYSAGGRKVDNVKLCFVREDREKFDLPDLLKASAEILGSGCFGASYKAALPSGTMMVKRFKKMNNVGKDEFQEHMRRLGRLHHPNLLSLVAYYYRKEEKLLVTDYVERGSLAAYLHGNHTPDHPSLDWPNRLKIVKGVAKGLAYLHRELPSLVAPHGHLKSSNVLLDHNMEPLLSDYGLIPIINYENAQELMVAYKSPEYARDGRLNKKTDTWSLGILILEVLTGHTPPSFMQQNQGNHAYLETWVNSIWEKGNKEALDKRIGAPENCEREMLKLLEIGFSCCEGDVEKRPCIKEVSERIENVKEESDE